MISFKTTKEDAEIIASIVTRALIQAGQHGIDLNPLSLNMDITACHANGNPLRLQELLDADSFNFAHDVFGIYRHIDRNTGKMLDFFVPRFTQRNKAAA